MFWAATRTGPPAQASTAARSAVYGGQTTTSGPTPGTRGSREFRNSSASATVLCIFQLAARIGTRSAIRDLARVAQGLDPWQLRSLQELERGPAAGRKPVNLVVEAEL